MSTDLTFWLRLAALPLGLLASVACDTSERTPDVTEDATADASGECVGAARVLDAVGPSVAFAVRRAPLAGFSSDPYTDWSDPGPGGCSALWAVPYIQWDIRTADRVIHRVVRDSNGEWASSRYYPHMPTIFLPGPGHVTLEVSTYDVAHNLTRVGEVPIDSLPTHQYVASWAWLPADDADGPDEPGQWTAFPAGPGAHCFPDTQCCTLWLRVEAAFDPTDPCFDDSEVWVDVLPGQWTQRVAERIDELLAPFCGYTIEGVEESAPDTGLEPHLYYTRTVHVILEEPSPELAFAVYALLVQGSPSGLGPGRAGVRPAVRADAGCRAP